MELGKAIEILKDWIEVDRKTRDFKEPISDYDKFCENRNIAIETVVKGLAEEYERGYQDGANDICSRI